MLVQVVRTELKIAQKHDVQFAKASLVFPAFKCQRHSILFASSKFCFPFQPDLYQINVKENGVYSDQVQDESVLPVCIACQCALSSPVML